jgi:hypothetical protein
MPGQFGREGLPKLLGNIPNVRLGALVEAFFGRSIPGSGVPPSGLDEVDCQSKDRDYVDHGERQQDQQDNLKDEWQAGSQGVGGRF